MTDIALYLIEQKVYINNENKINKIENTALYYACRNRNKVIIDDLLKPDLIVNKMNKQCDKSLLVCCEENYMKYMMKYYIKRNEKDNFLYLNNAIVKILLDHGFNPNITNEKGYTP